MLTVCSTIDVKKKKSVDMSITEDSSDMSATEDSSVGDTRGENDTGGEKEDVSLRDGVGVTSSEDDITVIGTDDSGTTTMEVGSIKKTDVVSNSKASDVVPTVKDPSTEEDIVPRSEELAGAIGEEAEGNGTRGEGKDVVAAAITAMEVESSLNKEVVTPDRNWEELGVKDSTTDEGRIADEKGRTGEVGVAVNAWVEEGTSISEGMVKDGDGIDGVGVITMSTAVVSMTMNAVVLNGMSTVSSISMSTASSSTLALAVGDGKGGEG